MVYEYLITFDQEVAIVWRKRISLTSVLLLVLRWGMVSIVILQNLIITSDEVSYVPADATISFISVFQGSVELFITRQIF